MLAAFGRAFGKLPENSGETSKDQKEFLEQAVSGLAQEGKVICVRLALFAEMMKGKPWTPATLKEVGGTEGVGVTFLEETFSAATAPPEHRYHQKAARAVLKALLPESGTDIKGHMRSYAELLEASGYASRPKDFDDLIRILDSEIRLITPTDPEGKEERVTPPSQAQARSEILPTDPRLSGSLAAGLADPQAEGNPPGPGGIAAGGSCGGLERPPGEPATALAVAVVPDPLVDAEEELDAAAAENDAEGGRIMASFCWSWWQCCWWRWPSSGTRTSIGRDREANATRAEGWLPPTSPKSLQSWTQWLPYRTWADPLLKRKFDKAEGLQQRLNMSPGPAASGSSQVELLYEPGCSRHAEPSAGDRAP